MIDLPARKKNRKQNISSSLCFVISANTSKSLVSLSEFRFRNDLKEQSISTGGFISDTVVTKCISLY